MGKGGFFWVAMIAATACLGCTDDPKGLQVDTGCGDGCSVEGKRAQVDAGCRDGCSGDGAADVGCSTEGCEAPGPTLGCGIARYREGLPTSGVLYVDGAYAGPHEGSADKPFASVVAALGARTASTTTIAIAEGVYSESLEIHASLTLSCRCAAKVRLAGGVAVSGADVSVVVDGCQVAPGDFQTDAPSTWGSCEGEAPRGIKVIGGPSESVELKLVDSVVGGYCVGVHFNAAATSSSALCIERSRLVANHKGLEVFNAPLLRLPPTSPCSGAEEAVAVVSSAIEHNEFAGVFTRQKARGIALFGNLIAWTGSLTPGSRAQPAQIGGYGVYLGDTTSAHIRDNTISHNANVGLGVINALTPLNTVLLIEHNLVVGNVGAGIALQQLQADRPVSVRQNRVEGTFFFGDGTGGDGIQISVNQGVSYGVLVEENTVSSSMRHGVFLDGIEGSVSGNSVGKSGGYGLFLQRTPQVSVDRNLFTGNKNGDVHRTDTNAEQYGVLPVPLP